MIRIMKQNSIVSSLQRGALVVLRLNAFALSITLPHCSANESLQLHCKELHNTEFEAEHDAIPGEGGLR